MQLTIVYPVPTEKTWVRVGIRNNERFMQVDETRGAPCLVFVVDG